MIEQLKPYFKAAGAAIVCAAAYLVGVVPAEGGFGDVSVVQWLGLVVFMGGAYGLTFHLPYVSTKPTDERGAVDVVGAAIILVAVVVVLWWFGVRP